MAYFKMAHQNLRARAAESQEKHQTRCTSSFGPSGITQLFQTLLACNVMSNVHKTQPSCRHCVNFLFPIARRIQTKRTQYEMYCVLYQVCTITEVAVTLRKYWFVGAARLFFFVCLGRSRVPRYLCFKSLGVY
jgi:hypothetical protein